MSAVHVIVPNDIDDPRRPSGGNRYDRELINRLGGFGWQVTEHAVAGAWPDPEPAALRRLTDTVAGIPSGQPVIIDGLIASAAAPVVVCAARRLPVVVLMHMPLGGSSRAALDEVRAVQAAHAVVTTSAWTRNRLLDLYQLRGERVHVAEPGADPEPVAPAGREGQGLLCVAALAPHKGQDLLVDALRQVSALPWTCVCAGSLDVDRTYVAAVRARADAAGLGDRLRFAGPLVGEDLRRAYRAADGVVVPSRLESYGLVVTEALARGIPVIARNVGGVPEALGRAPDGRRPGLLVEPEDPDALAAALRSWLSDGDLRERLRRAARQRRETLATWTSTARCVAQVLGETYAAASADV